MKKPQTRRSRELKQARHSLQVTEVSLITSKALPQLCEENIKIRKGRTSTEFCVIETTTVS